MANCKRLRDPHLNVSASPAEGELARALDRVSNEEPVEHLAGLRRVLDGLRSCRRCPAPGGSRTLDLIAHTDPRRLLRLGSSVIDLTRRDVRRHFERIAADRILDRLQIDQVRLLGCETAMSTEGQAAIRDLTDILKVRVLGTTKLVYAAYFDELGLQARFERMLCDASSLPDLEEKRHERAAWPQDPAPAPAPPLEIDQLVAVPRSELPPVPWPRVDRGRRGRGRTAAARDGGQLSNLIDRDDGRLMPRMLTTPRCEVLVGPAEKPVRRIQVLFDCDMVRVQPTGASAPAVYRVKDPRALESWIARASARSS